MALQFGQVSLAMALHMFLYQELLCTSLALILSTGVTFVLFALIWHGAPKPEFDSRIEPI